MNKYIYKILCWLGFHKINENAWTTEREDLYGMKIQKNYCNRIGCRRQIVRYSEDYFD